MSEKNKRKKNPLVPNLNQSIISIQGIIISTQKSTNFCFYKTVTKH